MFKSKDQNIQVLSNNQNNITFVQQDNEDAWICSDMWIDSRDL